MADVELIRFVNGSNNLLPNFGSYGTCNKLSINKMSSYAYK